MITGKRGMSPLIMTILLIAFAVALGAMIMNWSSDAVITPRATCEATKLEVQTAFNRDLICFNTETGKLKVVVKNTGSTTINSLIYRRINADFSVRELKLPDSTMSPGKIYEAEIPYQMTNNVHIEIIPEIKSGEEITICSSKTILKESLQNCGV